MFFKGKNVGNSSFFVSKNQNRKDEQKNEKEENLMERSFRSHRNRTRYHGVYQRIRPARTHDSFVYRVVDLGKRSISCSFYLDKA